MGKYLKLWILLFLTSVVTLFFSISWITRIEFVNIFNEFEILYKNGAKLGETVNCFYVKEENAHIVVMKNPEDNRLHAIIQLKEN